VIGGARGTGLRGAGGADGLVLGGTVGCDGFVRRSRFGWVVLGFVSLIMLHSLSSIMIHSFSSIPTLMQRSLLDWSSYFVPSTSN